MLTAIPVTAKNPRFEDVGVLVSVMTVVTSTIVITLVFGGLAVSKSSEIVSVCDIVVWDIGFESVCCEVVGSIEVIGWVSVMLVVEVEVLKVVLWLVVWVKGWM